MAQLVSIKNGQCLSAPGPYGAAMITAPCNNNDAKQKIQISNYDSSDKVQWSTNNAKIDTWQGVLYNSNECGRGNDCDFLFNNTVGNIGVGKGPFRVRGWGAGDNWAYPDASGKIVQNADSPVSTDTWWLTQDEYNDCKQYGIPLYQCTPQNRQDCSLYNNYLRDTCKASQCPTSKNISDSTCQAWCVNNAGACDQAVSAYCTANPTDTNFCGCYNIQKYQTILKLLGDNAQTWIPRCSAQECASSPTAYMTKNMLNTKCSDQQICLQELNVNTTASELTGIVQTCSQKSNSNSTAAALSVPAVNGSTAAETTPSYSSSTSNSSNTSSSTSNGITKEQYIIGGAVGGGILLICVSVAIMLYARQKD